MTASEAFEAMEWGFVGMVDCPHYIFWDVAVERMRGSVFWDKSGFDRDFNHLFSDNMFHVNGSTLTTFETFSL